MTALQIGIDEHSFWDMTFAEVSRKAEAYNELHIRELRERAQMDYTHAQFLGSIIGKILGGHGDIPSLQDLYPNLFEQAPQEKIDEKSIANFMQFAQLHNKRFKDGRDI